MTNKSQHTIVVTVYGDTGTGKTTIAAGLFGLLEQHGLCVCSYDLENELGSVALAERKDPELLRKLRTANPVIEIRMRTTSK